MDLNIEHLHSFVVCPRYASYQIQNTNSVVPFRLSVFESVIKKCLLQATQTSYRADWRTLLGWVNSAVFGQQEIFQDDSFKAAKTLTEYILNALHPWYHNFYLKNNYDAFPDIRLSSVIHSHTVYGTVPIILSSDPPAIVVFQEAPITHWDLFNNWTVRALMWLAQSALNVDDLKCIGFAIGEHGLYNMVSTRTRRVDYTRFDNQIQQVIFLAGQKIDYAIKSDRCNTCIFLERCLL